MTTKKFESPREEALEIARRTRNDKLEGEPDTLSVLRACLAIADSLNKHSDKEWMTSELSGYNGKDVPSYRKLSCQCYNEHGVLKDFQQIDLWFPVHTLLHHFDEEEPFNAVHGEKTFEVTPSHLEYVLGRLVDRCFFFLNSVITELQYGGIVEYLMEEIRKSTDEKLTKLDRKLADETQSLVQNLTSTNPADWNKVGHSCRKILLLIADKVFPPRDELYIKKDGKELHIGASDFINRLYAFFDEKMSGNERKFVMAETSYLEAYLRQVVEYDQMGEHKPSIEKFHANIMAIHTYLIASEILKHLP